VYADPIRRCGNAGAVWGVKKVVGDDWGGGPSILPVNLTAAVSCRFEGRSTGAEESEGEGRPPPTRW